MKRSSLLRIGESAQMAAARFPLVLLLAAVAAIAGMVLVDDNNSDWLLKIFLAAQLGIPLLLAVTVATEVDTWPGGSAVAAWLALGVAGLLLVVYHFALPTPLGEAGFVRHVQLNVAAHLAVAVLPFLQRGENNAFWQYNLGLALRLLAGLFFSHVLFGGLSVALVALDKLLGVDMDESVYPRLWVAILFIFNTWYFLAGIPARPRQLETVTHPPAIVRVFAQFILAPLVMVYLAILTAYLVKVLVTAEWPSGQIGYLVSSVAVAGIFSLLLLYPLSLRPGIRWVGIYARIYYILLVPAVIMLLMAIGKRIGQYGVTENRYLLTVMAIWLAGIVVVGVVRGRPFLKIVPASLAVVAILTAFGPLSAAQMSRRSQLGRLDGLLSSHGRLVDGRIVTATASVDRDDGQEIGSILRYLFGNHGPRVLGERADEELQEALNNELTPLRAKRVPEVKLANAVAQHANLPRVQPGPHRAAAYHRVQKQMSPRAIGLGDYDYLIEFEFPRDQDRAVQLGGRNLRLAMVEASTDLAVIQDEINRLELGLPAHLLRLEDNIELIDHQNVAPDSLMRVSVENADLRLMLLIEIVNWREEDDGTGTISHLQGILLVAPRPQY